MCLGHPDKGEQAALIKLTPRLSAQIQYINYHYRTAGCGQAWHSEHRDTETRERGEKVAVNAGADGATEGLGVLITQPSQGRWDRRIMFFCPFQKLLLFLKAGLFFQIF